MRKYGDAFIGKIIERSIQTNWGKTYFYSCSGKDKILVILEGDTKVPENLEKTYKFEGEMTYSRKKQIIKLHAFKIEPVPELDYKKELRKMIEGMRSENNAS